MTMKLLLDQGLPRSTPTWLNQAGMDAIHVAEIGLATATDANILQEAKTQGRVVVTLDADFHTLLALTQATSPSVIRVRIEKLRAQALSKLLILVTSRLAQELEQGAAITVERSRCRIHYLPLGSSRRGTPTHWF